MAYSVTKVGGFGRPSAYREFVIDSVDDVSTLPTSDIAVGSSAFCIADKSMYAFANSGAWMKCGSSGSDEGEGGGGSDLPDVTSADNGKVLTVVNGDWGVADAGGALVVTATYTDDEHGTLDKSYNEIFTAMQAGKPIVCLLDSTSVPGYNSGYTVYFLTQIANVEGLTYPYSVTMVMYNAFGGTWNSVDFGATTPDALLATTE